MRRRSKNKTEKPKNRKTEAQTSVSRALSLLADFKPKSADFGWRTSLDHLLKYKALSYLCVMTVIDSRVGASSTVSASRGVQT